MTLTTPGPACQMKSAKERICVILGGGGHAKVLIDCLKAGMICAPLAVLDKEQSNWGKEILGVPIWGGDELLPEVIKQGANCFMVGVGSIGDFSTRRFLFELGISMGLTPLTVIHPSAQCSPWASVGPGSMLFPGSIVNAGARLGANVIINSGAIVEHDCLVEDHVHVATGARMASGVRVGLGAHLGIGSTVRQGLTIGSGALVGAGAVVVRDVPAQETVMGVPARPRPPEPNRQ